MLYLFVVATSKKESGATSVPTTSSGSGSQSSATSSMISGLPTTINQVITELNSTVESLGLNASAFVAPVVCATAPNNLQIPQAHSVINIQMIFPNASAISLASDGKISMPPPTVSNASRLAAPTNSPEHSLDAELEAPHPIVSSDETDWGGSNQLQAAQPQNFKQEFAPEDTGTLKRRRLKRGTAVEMGMEGLGTAEDVDALFDDLENQQGSLYRFDLPTKGDSSVACSGRASESEHSLVETEKRSRPTYTCERCGKSYSQPSQLKDHSHSHEGTQYNEKSNLGFLGESLDKECYFQCRYKAV